MKKTELQKALAAIAPSICIRTIWEHDEDCRDIRKDVCDMEDEDPDDWQAWQSNVKAVAIVNGEEIEGNAYLGGTWEKAGDVPEESNPEISGYENQMTVEALEELFVSPAIQPSLAAEIGLAIDYCKREADLSYDKQMAESPN
mgnify:CR=1 FL=1|jgi:hypothetical protein